MNKRQAKKLSKKVVFPPINKIAKKRNVNLVIQDTGNIDKCLSMITGERITILGENGHG